MSGSTVVFGATAKTALWVVGDPPQKAATILKPTWSMVRGGTRRAMGLPTSVPKRTSTVGLEPDAARRTVEALARCAAEAMDAVGRALEAGPPPGTISAGEAVAVGVEPPELLRAASITFFAARACFVVADEDVVDPARLDRRAEAGTLKGS